MIATEIALVFCSYKINVIGKFHFTMCLLLIQKAGSPEVNGIYYQINSTTFRKEHSNIGLLLWTDNIWYFSDCGPEFTPAGVDHLDFYTAPSSPVSTLASLSWEVSEDGLSPRPQISSLNSFDSLVSVPFFSAAVLRELSQYSASHKKEISDLLGLKYGVDGLSFEDLSAVVGVEEISVFFEFYLSACTELVRRLDPRKIKNVTEILEISELERNFRSRGLEIAETVRDVYRKIETLGISDRDKILGRTRLFAAADFLRSVVTGGRLDGDGRDAFFRVFWTEAAKDEDPDKETKCPVIKEALDRQDELVISECLAKRSRLLAGTSEVIDLNKLAIHDCHNNELRLISIHGIVWNVTDNLEKYAPEGEYHFFPGKDITFPMAVSSLSDKHANKFFALTPEMLLRVYGWIDYFEKKYTVYAKLAEWQGEAEFPEAPKEDTEENMDCVLM